MEIPRLGRFTEDEYGSYRSDPVAIPVLWNATCHFVFAGYDDDPVQADFHTAVSAFLDLEEPVLMAAAPSIFEYYLDVVSDHGDDPVPVLIESAGDVLAHVHPGRDVEVRRDRYGDQRIYVSAECECDWEPEHGLQIVFRDGRTVTKVGPFDGHLTNPATYGSPEPDSIYRRIK